MVEHITKDNLQSLLSATKKGVILKISADWCGPCQQMKPIFEEVAKEMGSDYIFGHVNVDDEREIAIEYGVSSVPTFVFIKDGEVKAMETGYMDKADLIQAISSTLG